MPYQYDQNNMTSFPVSSLRDIRRKWHYSLVVTITVHSSPFNVSYGEGVLGFLARRETNVPQSTFVTDPGSHASSASAILSTFGLMDGRDSYLAGVSQMD